MKIAPIKSLGFGDLDSSFFHLFTPRIGEIHGPLLNPCGCKYAQNASWREVIVITMPYIASANCSRLQKCKTYLKLHTAKEPIRPINDGIGVTPCAWQRRFSLCSFRFFRFVILLCVYALEPPVLIGRLNGPVELISECFREELLDRHVELLCKHNRQTWIDIVQLGCTQRHF